MWEQQTLQGQSKTHCGCGAEEDLTHSIAQSLSPAVQISETTPGSLLAAELLHVSGYHSSQAMK